MQITSGKQVGAQNHKHPNRDMQKKMSKSQNNMFKATTVERKIESFY